MDATVPLGGALAFADKTSQRHANSHAIVNATLVADVGADGIVTRCAAAFGGVVAAGLFVPTAAPAALLGHKLDEAALGAFVGALVAEATAA